MDIDAILELRVDTSVESADDNEASLFESDTTAADTPVDNELMSEVLFAVLLTIMELITTIVEFMVIPDNITEFSCNRLFNVVGAPFTVFIIAASTAFTRSTTSELIICEIA